MWPDVLTLHIDVMRFVSHCPPRSSTINHLPEHLLN